MPTIKGRISVSETTIRRQTRIVSHEIRLGKVLLSNSQQGYTKFSAWVPKPTDINHKPGTFLSMSNPLGRAFVRLNSDDLGLLIQSLQDWQSSLRQAEIFATTISDALIDLDKNIHAEHPLINYTIKDITLSSDVPGTERASADA